MESFGACSWGQKWQKEAYLFLRVVTGLVFLTHGYIKIFTYGVDKVVTSFTDTGVPAASLVAPIVAYGELIGGVALILGLFTHWIAKFNVVVILGAIFFVHLKNGYSAATGGYEYPLLILVANILIITMGAGIYSLDEYRSKRAASPSS